MTTERPYTLDEITRAVPGHPHKIRYPEPKDPDTLALYWQHQAEDLERELEAIKPKQIVPGSKGQLLLVDST